MRLPATCSKFHPLSATFKTLAHSNPVCSGFERVNIRGMIREKNWRGDQSCGCIMIFRLQRNLPLPIHQAGQQAVEYQPICPYNHHLHLNRALQETF